MDVICGKEVEFISYLQTALGRWEKQMLFFSHFGDPRNSFLVYFPFAYHVNGCLGLNVLWSAILSEWCNLLLKWILRGERPYWWIHETDKWMHINLTQYELTCETGPGAPSGHAMVTASVWFLIVAFFVMQLKATMSTSQQEHRLCVAIPTVCLWAGLVSLLALVSISRVFIATHFPHQVFLGILVGVSLAYMLKKDGRIAKVTNLNQCFVISLILIMATLLCYYVLSRAVYDPSLSLSKAQKWCIDPSYIHLDTTPFYALVRDAGTACGIGLAYSLVNVCGITKPYSLRSVPVDNGTKLSTGQESSSLLNRSLKILLSLFSLQVLELLTLPRSHILVFYVFGYAKNVLIPVIVVFLVPCICSFIHSKCGKLYAWHAKQQ